MYNRGNRVEEGYIRDYDDTASMASTAVSSTNQGLIKTHLPSQLHADSEMLRQCPFDPVHVVQAYRYQRHILRCRKQNPEKARNFRQCKYNAMHFFHRLKIDEHEKECPDKNRAERLEQPVGTFTLFIILFIMLIPRTLHDFGNRQHSG